jgi:hypothetical protein
LPVLTFTLFRSCFSSTLLTFLYHHHHHHHHQKRRSRFLWVPRWSWSPRRRLSRFKIRRLHGMPNVEGGLFLYFPIHWQISTFLVSEFLWWSNLVNPT